MIVKAHFTPAPVEPHTGIVTAVQKHQLIYDIEMSLFHLWESVHGTGKGFERWLADNDTDAFIDRMIITIHDGDRTP